jgi:hypothetical protein
MKFSEQSYSLKNKFLQTIIGKILKGDHTFDIANIPTEEFEKIFSGMYTIMNEYNMILGYWMLPSKELDDIRGPLSEVCVIHMMINPR